MLRGFVCGCDDSFFIIFFSTHRVCRHSVPLCADQAVSHPRRVLCPICPAFLQMPDLCPFAIQAHRADRPCSANPAIRARSASRAIPAMAHVASSPSVACDPSLDLPVCMPSVRPAHPGRPLRGFPERRKAGFRPGVFPPGASRSRPLLRVRRSGPAHRRAAGRRGSWAWCAHRGLQPPGTSAAWAEPSPVLSPPPTRLRRAIERRRASRPFYEPAKPVSPR